MEILGFFVLALLCYLIGKVAYNEGRKSKWEEMSRDYICIHKSVLIQPNKPLDKTKQKSYHKEHKSCKSNKSNKISKNNCNKVR